MDNPSESIDVVLPIDRDATLVVMDELRRDGRWDERQVYGRGRGWVVGEDPPSDTPLDFAGREASELTDMKSDHYQLIRCR